MKCVFCWKGMRLPCPISWDLTNHLFPIPLLPRLSATSGFTEDPTMVEACSNLMCGNVVQAAGGIKIEPLPSTGDVILPGSKCPNVTDAHLKLIWNSLRCSLMLHRRRSHKKKSPNNRKWWRAWRLAKNMYKNWIKIWYLIILIYRIVISDQWMVLDVQSCACCDCNSSCRQLCEKIRPKQKEPQRSQKIEHGLENRFSGLHSDMSNTTWCGSCFSGGPSPFPRKSAFPRIKDSL